MSMEVLSVRQQKLTYCNAETMKEPEPLREHVRAAMKEYFQRLNGHGASGLYQMVLSEVEEPLLETVMDYAEGNQTRAANILGISRSTLRKKLGLYNLD